MPSCEWEGGSPSEACPSAATQGRALSATGGSGLSCESIPPPEIKPEGRIAAGNEECKQQETEETHGMPLRNQRREFSEITP